MFILDEQPDVIPLQYSATADTEGTGLSMEDLLAWGITNTWEDGKEGRYLVRHSHRAVNDFGRPQGGGPAPDQDNLFEKAFPILFPYGVGGIEANRVEDISFIEHVRWCLYYHDSRFRLHPTFAFLAFGIEQRRQVMKSARVQMNRRTFHADVHLLSSITPADLRKAAKDEAERRPISHPGVRLLKKHIHAVAGRIMGSDQGRYRLRSKIWSTSIMLGPPSLWITINPDDLHDPILQIIAGEDIDMDHFQSSLGPDKDCRARNAAKDPFAAALFFKFIVTTVLESLFQIRLGDSGRRIDSEEGIVGKVAGYFGVVESQGRGTLHLHMFVWLKNAPSADEMLDLLTQPSFRAKVKTYIQHTFHAHVDGISSDEDVHSIPAEAEIGYSRPPDPSSVSYDEDFSAFERRVARTKQVHTCKKFKCLRPDKYGRWQCKRGAPWPVADADWIDEKGNWGPKRTYGYLNSWIPDLSVAMRCNNDGKLLTNGRDTGNITFYETAYAAKKQGRNHNLSALLARSPAFTVRDTDYSLDLRNRNRLMLIRCIHTMNGQQEIAAPLVMMYLMGWGDVFCSHNYQTVYWSSFVHFLLEHAPQLRSALR